MTEHIQRLRQAARKGRGCNLTYKEVTLLLQAISYLQDKEVELEAKLDAMAEEEAIKTQGVEAQLGY